LLKRNLRRRPTPIENPPGISLVLIDPTTS
jgi:hypothetical protein